MAVVWCAIVYLGLVMLGRERSLATRSRIADRTLRSESDVRLSAFASSVAGVNVNRDRVDLFLVDDALVIEPAGYPWFVAYRVGFDGSPTTPQLVLPGRARRVRLTRCEVKSEWLVLHLDQAPGAFRLSLQVADPEQWAEEISALRDARP